MQPTPHSKGSHLLPDSTLVECELLTLQDITIGAAALAGAGGHNSKKTTSLELLLQSRLDLSRGLQASGLLCLDALALLGIIIGSLLLPPPANASAVVGLIPLPERRSIDLDDGRARQSIRADEFVVGGVERDTDDTGLLCNTLRAPGEVTGVDTEGAEFAVTATGADKMNTLGADTGVGGLAALLESSGAMLDMVFRGNRVMHTSSCGSMRASRQRRNACDGSHERYYENVSQSLFACMWILGCAITPWLRFMELTARQRLVDLIQK